MHPEKMGPGGSAEEDGGIVQRCSELIRGLFARRSTDVAAFWGETGQENGGIRGKSWNNSDFGVKSCEIVLRPI